MESSEPSGDTVIDILRENRPRTKRRSFVPSFDSTLPAINVDKKKEPVISSAQVPAPISRAIQEDTECFQIWYFIWLLSRTLSAKDQVVSVFSGWTINVQKNFDEIEKTILTYLPPINSPITEFSTIYEIFEIVQKKAVKGNIKYANITFDIGAAMNAYKVLWNYPDKLKNIVIHLGDFHFIKEVFAILGKLISGSGFEDVIFQAGLCSAGSLNGVVAGSHYNRCWFVHGHLAETLERLLFERFLTTIDSIPDILKDETKCNSMDECNEQLANDEKIAELFDKYSQFQEQVRQGHYEKTSQFWLIYYLDIMRNQHLIHTAIQSNNFSMRLSGLKNMLPYMFVLNRQNYARYGSLYVNTLENLDITHPGCRELIQFKGLSVQGQDRYPGRVAIDQRGEQTINRDAKVAGGIKFFAADPNAITKWTLNRAAQAKSTEALYSLADVKSPDDIYKINRPSQIIKSEKFVQKIHKVVTQEYSNPFHANIDFTRLYNLSSGVPVESEHAKSIIGVKMRGEDLYGTFVDKRIKSSMQKIHDPIKREKIQVFKNTGKTVVVKSENKKLVVEVNRNILGKLLAFSAKTGRQIDFERALTYPLSPIPLSLANPDGSRRTTATSKFMEIILSYCNTSTDPKDVCIPKEEISAYLVDLMALIRTLPGLFDTYRDLSSSLFTMLPVGYDRIDIVSDTYRERSLKGPERVKRGTASKVMIQSSHSKIPRNFSEFLKNGENKTRLIETVKDELVAKKTTVLQELKCRSINFSMDGICYGITKDSVEVIDELSSNQEEADTKLLLHAKHAKEMDQNRSVLVRSPSGDVDINVLFTSMFKEDNTDIYIEYGSGKFKKNSSAKLD